MPPDMDEEIYAPVLQVLEKQRANIYLTGRAGTGKTTLLKRFVARNPDSTAVLAPTGIAAITVGGQTIHSFFRFPPRLIEAADIKRMRHAKALQAITTLVIDEASMIRADVMAAIDKSLRLNRQSEQPFGGVQMVLVGDPYQLPPVIERGLESYLQEQFGGCYFFSPPAFRDAEFRLIELTRVFRQSDPVFLEVLAGVRGAELDRNQTEMLADCVSQMDPVTASNTHVVLTGTNRAAFEINQQRLLRLEGKPHSYAAQISGEFATNLFPTEAPLVLKAGARVILLKNDPDKRWVNGTLAVVTEVGENRLFIKIDGSIHKVEPASWERIRYQIDAKTNKLSKEVIGTFKQYPLRLAWALTIHKSQGQTLDKVYVDLRRGLFAHGQAYVALSRCRTLEGLHLSRMLRPADMILDRRALALGRLGAIEEFDGCRMAELE
ncbi:DNA repair and recombination protein, putative helicase [hydrothermal vent metagenome]|uniref:DNA repair and recombination protein, putative helicase n=1 Tax=hydrothermal vent metagenome TaxID=652676 RepID=A0A3B0R0Z2_9ZZZZ